MVLSEHSTDIEVIGGMCHPIVMFRPSSVLLLPDYLNIPPVASSHHPAEDPSLEPAILASVPVA